MSVGFQQIPQDIRVPLFYAEMDNSMANSAPSTLRRLIVGQVNDTSTSAQIGKLTLVSSLAQAKAIGGQGSMLAAMYSVWRENDPVGEIWCLPLKADTGAVATGKVSFTGAATEPGLISLYIGGDRVQASIPSGSNPTAAAAAVATKINAAADLPVTATAAAGDVTLTAKWKGASANDIGLVLNRLGQSNGEVTPAGLTVAITALAGGAGSPDATAALAALGDAPFEFLCVPWTDTTTLDAWKAAMNDMSGRWSWAKQLYGHVFGAMRGTLGVLVAAGQGRNDQHATIFGFEQGVPQPFWQVAAAAAARQAVFISADASRPTQTGALVGIDPAPEGSRFMLNEYQSLLQYGIATLYFEGGYMRIQRAITTYQKNAYGQPDDSYLDSETMHQSAYIVRRLKSIITSKYGRHKLANDGTQFGDGQPIVTPNVIRGELISEYGKMELDGHVENSEMFQQYLIVERDSNNPSRVNVLYPPDYVNGLRIFALLNQFRQQYAADAA